MNHQSVEIIGVRPPSMQKRRVVCFSNHNTYHRSFSSQTMKRQSQTIRRRIYWIVVFLLFSALVTGFENLSEEQDETDEPGNESGAKQRHSRSLSADNVNEDTSLVPGYHHHRRHPYQEPYNTNPRGPLAGILSSFHHSIHKAKDMILPTYNKERRHPDSAAVVVGQALDLHISSSSHHQVDDMTTRTTTTTSSTTTSTPQEQERSSDFDRMAIRRLSHRHAFLAQSLLLDNNNKAASPPQTIIHPRMAHACCCHDENGRFGLTRNDDDDDANYDFHYFLGQEYQERQQEGEFIHSFAGMRLHVFQQQQQCWNDKQPEQQQDSSVLPPPNLPLASGDISDHYQAPTVSHADEYFIFDMAYELMEPMHLELGIVPQHYWDYAYTPVYYYNNHNNHYVLGTNSNGGGVGGGGGHEKDDDDSRRLPSRQRARPFRKDDPGKKSTRSSEETCVAIEGALPTTKPAADLEDDADADDTSSSSTSSTCNAIQQSDHQQQRDDRDSWWKWWFPFSNPWWKDSSSESKQSEYTMGRTAFAGGSHGQVWRGRRVCTSRQRRRARRMTGEFFEEEHGGDNDDEDCDEDKPLILKRLKVEQGYRLLEAGLREIYFGQWIERLVHESERDLFTKYVDHFFRELPRSTFGSSSSRSSSSSKDLELWIVFEDAGPSLRNYLYAPVMAPGGFVMYQHSPLWAQLRMTNRDISQFGNDADADDDDLDSIEILSTLDEAENASRKNHTKHERNKSSSSEGVPNIGRQILRSVLRQILSAAAVLHENGIVHRDIKPSNVMCVSDVPLDDLYALERLPNIQCRLGDFSSGWDQYTNENLYTKGPSPAEQTDEYAPPESYFDPQWVPFDERRPQSYDSWSIGVLALELLLGTPNVFSVDQRTTVLLESKMKKEGASDEELQRALYLAALSHFCIYVPNSANKQQQSSWPHRHGDPLHKTAMAKDSCTLQDFHRALRARDPLGMGFDSSTDLLLHLIWQLVAWDPMERITAAEALQHPFFLSPDGTRQSLELIPGRHNALESQMLDPRLDFSVDDNVHEFICPKCGRVFADWISCNRHATTRRHAKFCTYDRTNLPTCINTHSMLPAHPTSGYCDLQGRRRTIEDFHSIHLYADIQFYGIFDGHTGNVASKYAASTLFDRLVRHLPGLHQGLDHDERDWKAVVEKNVSQAFQATHEGFLKALALAPTMDQSGTTATALLVTKEVVILSSLGDSRAVLASSDVDGNLNAIQMTNDHVASDPTERDLVLARGGAVFSSSGGLERVNGTLAITRSIGDAALAPLLSRQPDVTSMKRNEIQALCGSPRDDLPCFLVLASDGLWDVMTNQEAVDMVAEVVATYDSTDRVSWNNGGAFQEAAEVLAVDAYVRGSTDNIGVCIVAIAD